MVTANKKVTSRGIQLALGILWFIDGALQLQHQMFTANFANDVIAPAAQGQPIFVRGVMHFFIHIFLTHPAICNTLIAAIQMGLGIAILWKKTIRYGLIASVFWGIFVWYVGEGLGGLAGWQTSILMGAPGGALIYSLLALGVMPKNNIRDGQHNSRRPAYWLAIVWAILWIAGGVYQLLPGQNTVTDVSSMIAGNASGAPGWLASLDVHTANFINGLATPMTSMTDMHMSAMQMAQMQTKQWSGYWFILLLALVQFCIGLGVLFQGYWRKVAVGAGIILSLVFWAVGQSFGAYFTGLATDPSTAPLFILIGVAIVGCTDLDKRLGRIAQHITDVII